MHTCPMVTVLVPHVGGPILPPCEPTVLIGFLPAARITDMLTCVGPPDMIAMGSPTVLIGNLMAARIGDPTVHGGVIVLGEPTVMIGEVGMGAPVTVLPDVPMPVAALPDPPAGPLQPAANSSSSPDDSTGATTGAVAGTPLVSPPPSPSSPPSADQPKSEKPEKTWIGIELRDFDGTPVKGQNFKIVLDKGTTLSGKTDDQGRACFEGVDPDSGRVHVTDIPDEDDRSATLNPSGDAGDGPISLGPIQPVTQAPPREEASPTSEEEPEFPDLDEDIPEA